jgi:RHS repeat-associated protein
MCAPPPSSLLARSPSYDANSNRLSDGSGSYPYSPTANRLNTRLGINVSYDPAGNLTADGTGRTFTYNQAGQLYQALKGGILQATYYYNHQGQRVRKLTSASAPQGAQTVLYQYDLQGQLLVELTGTGTPIRTYVWRDDTPLAQIEHQPSRKILYFETDHLNTPRAAMDETGKVVWRWESDAFGATVANEDPDGDGVKVTVNLRLPGQYYDVETGLHYNYFRDYDPSTGRYVQSDPIGLRGGLNGYSYANQNPVMFTDPLGLKPWDWNGQGNVSKCSYYDDMAKKFPTCGYYKRAGDICRGQDNRVNRMVNLGLRSAWTFSGLQDSQATVLNNIRDLLIQEDITARNANLTDKSGCTCGNTIDDYHNFAFDFSGLPAWSYGGNDWPQSIPPNPVPADPRNGNWSPGNWLK